MNNIDTHIAMLALDGETRVIGRGQFVVWDDVQEKWMLGNFPFVPNQRFTHMVALRPISERVE